MKLRIFRVLCLLFIIAILPIANYYLYNILTFARIHQDSDDLAPRTVLVLGAGKSSIYDPRENYAFTSRMKCAAELYEKGLTEKIIVSGMSNKVNYDEPNDMKKYLISLGVPGYIIFPDHGGTRTYNSVLRAASYYKEKHITIISQKQHLQRAIFIAMMNGIDAHGYDAGVIPPPLPEHYKRREFLARLKSSLDCFILRPEIP